MRSEISPAHVVACFKTFAKGVLLTASKTAGKIDPQLLQLPIIQFFQNGQYHLHIERQLDLLVRYPTLREPTGDDAVILCRALYDAGYCEHFQVRGEDGRKIDHPSFDILYPVIMNRCWFPIAQYVKGRDSLSYHEKALEKIILIYLKNWKTGNLPFKVMAPLYYFDISAKRFKFSDALYLRKLTESDRTRLWNSGYQNERWVNIGQFAYAHSAFEFSSVDASSHELLRCAVTALRLAGAARTGSPGLLGYAEFVDTVGGSFQPVQDMALSVPFELSDFTEIWDARALKKAQKIFRILVDNNGSVALPIPSRQGYDGASGGGAA